MSKSRAAVVLERAKNWVDIDLVAGTGEKAASIIISKIVSRGS
jgi:hypothetical protein